MRATSARLAGLVCGGGPPSDCCWPTARSSTSSTPRRCTWRATSFSLYATSSPEQIAHLLEDAGFPVVVTEPALAARAHEAGTRSRILLHEELDALPVDEGFDFDAAWRAVAADDIACLIYTSGTTGPPKGVQLTHANVLAELDALRTVYEYASGDSLVSFLPHAHIATGRSATTRASSPRSS